MRSLASGNGIGPAQDRPDPGERSRGLNGLTT